MEYQKDHIVHRLRNEVDVLKKELTMNQLFLDQETSINMSKLRSEQINRSVVNYLNGSINDFTLVNATQAQQLLKSIKDFYNRLLHILSNVHLCYKIIDAIILPLIESLG